MMKVVGRVGWESSGRGLIHSLAQAAQRASALACDAPATMALAEICLFSICKPLLPALPMAGPFLSFWCQVKCHFLREIISSRYDDICPHTAFGTRPAVPVFADGRDCSLTQAGVSVGWATHAKGLTPWSSTQPTKVESVDNTLSSLLFGWHLSDAYLHHFPEILQH